MCFVTFLLVFHRTVILANNIVVLSKETSPKLIAEDVQKMRQFRSTKRFVCHVTRSHLTLTLIDKQHTDLIYRQTDR